MTLIMTNTDVVHQIIQRIEVTPELMTLVAKAHQRHVELPSRPGYWLHVHAVDLFIIGGPCRLAGDRRSGDRPGCCRPRRRDPGMDPTTDPAAVAVAAGAARGGAGPRSRGGRVA